MIDRVVADFSGTNVLNRAVTAALDLTGTVYASCFARQTGDGTFIANSVGWSISHASGVVNFLVRDATNATYSIAGDSVLTSGDWYFLECYHLASGAISIAITPVSQTAINNWKTPGTSSTHPLKSGGQITVGFLLTGQVHSFCLMNRVPTDAERSLLFNGGRGREFYEIPVENRGGIVAFYSLKEASGTRRDRSGNAYHLTEPGNAVASTTRSLTTIGQSHIAAPLAALRRLIADTATFQDWTDLEDGTAALERVYVDLQFATGNDGTFDWPYALIYGEQSQVSMSAMNFPWGATNVFLEAVAPAVDTYDARTEFTNRVGRLMNEMNEFATDPSKAYLIVRQITISGDIEHSTKDAGHPTYTALLTVDWGCEG